MKVRKQKIQVKWACNMTLGYNFKIIDDQLLSTSTIQMLNKYLYFQPEEWQGGVPSHSPLYAQCLVHCLAHYRHWQIFSINEWAGLYMLIFLGPAALSSLESFWETENLGPHPRTTRSDLKWFSVNGTDHVGEQFGIKLKSCPSLPDLHGRLQDGRVEARALIFSCKNFKITARCWATVHRRRLDPTRKRYATSKGKEEAPARW